MTALFNRLCAAPFGYLMIPVVGLGALGFCIIVVEVAKALFL